MKPLIAVIGIFSCMACSSGTGSDAKSGAASSADTYTTTSEDVAMNAAIAKAQETLGQFDTALKSNTKAFKRFAVKKRFITPGGGEHIWIAAIKMNDGFYRGFVNNDPEETKEVKYGDTVNVAPAEIVDWMYVDHGILRGGYTIRAMRNQMSEEERAQTDRTLGFRIED